MMMSGWDTRKKKTINEKTRLNFILLSWASWSTWRTRFGIATPDECHHAPAYVRNKKNSQTQIFQAWNAMHATPLIHSPDMVVFAIGFSLFQSRVFTRKSCRPHAKYNVLSPTALRSSEQQLRSLKAFPRHALQLENILLNRRRTLSVPVTDRAPESLWESDSRLERQRLWSMFDSVVDLNVASDTRGVDSQPLESRERPCLAGSHVRIREGSLELGKRLLEPSGACRVGRLRVFPFGEKSQNCSPAARQPGHSESLREKIRRLPPYNRLSSKPQGIAMTYLLRRQLHAVQDERKDNLPHTYHTPPDLKSTPLVWLTRG